ncbi:hypothetical protein B0H16DRAFT_1624232 [Mycena metata]|uniref:Uncharacterized protein n=1 Tax=Mycena metata TaxID=1033252 RepID=A0AAD7H5N1_9AGAR|nr:hypothetical protein B0H16DRAFT_1624232 [Mycena metata]
MHGRRAAAISFIPPSSLPLKNRSLTRLLSSRRYESTPRGINAEGHVAAVAHCPVGVNAERVERDMCVCFLLSSLSLCLHPSVFVFPGIQPKLAALRALYEGKKISVGVLRTSGCRGRV